MPALSNPKHEAVVCAYIADPQRIGSSAYSAVFPKASPRAAQTAWSRLLRKDGFAARLAEVEAEIAAAAIDSAVMDLHEVLAEFSKLGRANMVDFADVLVCDDVVAALEALPREHAAAIQELTIESYTEDGEPSLEDQAHGGGLRRPGSRQVKRVKFKLHSKPAALAELRKHHEPQRHEHTGADGNPIETKDVTERPSDLEIARRLAFLLSQATRTEGS